MPISFLMRASTGMHLRPEARQRGKRVNIFRSLIVLGTFSLAACGGGGGSGPVSNPPIAPPIQSPAPATTPPATTRAQNRANVQTALSAYEQTAGGGTSSVTGLALARRVLALHSGRPPLATPTCVASASGSSTSAVVSNSDGSSTVTDTTYFDQVCGLPETTIVLHVPATATSTSATFTGTSLTFDRTGATTSYGSFTFALTSNSSTTTLTFSESIAPNSSAPSIALLGLTCSVPTAVPTTITCGEANVLTASTGNSGLALALTETTPTTTLHTDVATFTASLYAGSGLGIAQGTGTTWSVTGGTPFDTLTGTVSVTLNGTVTTGGALSFSDTSSGATVSGVASSTSVSILLKNGATTLANATVDTFGNGTISYVDGTTETIVGFTIKAS